MGNLGPLAEYLAERLKEFGIGDGRVVIARDIQQMADLVRSGAVDIYFDSPFPSLEVSELAGSEVILRRWKGGDAEYWSTYVALAGNGIASVDDLLGKVMAFEEPHSTSGFVLPAGTLLQRGIALTEVTRPDAPVAANEVGYLFSNDGTNTVDMVLREVAGGGVSNQDYEEVPPELKGRIVAFDRTISVPRQLVSVRPGLDPKLVARIRALLTELDQTELGGQILDGLKKTRKFDALPADSRSALTTLSKLVDLVAKN